MNQIPPGIRVFSRDKRTVGLATGVARPCRLEGCIGRRLAVQWPRRARFSRSGVTYPCIHGMAAMPDGTWQIQ